MDNRREELNKLGAYTKEIDNELTMILQSLQWDRKELSEKPVMVTCRYDSNHKLPPDKTEEHEKECFLRQNGYSKDSQLLPDPLDPECSTLVKLSKEDIENIIHNASRLDPVFKKVYRITIQGSELQQLSDIGCHGAEPMSLERLQEVYSADERRAIHDAVVSAVPSCHDLTDLALLSGEDQGAKKVPSRMEILLELRNMRRRRTKYRVAAKTRNYSDVLRDVIKTQMEHYTEGKSDQNQNEKVDDPNERYHHSESSNSRYVSNDDKYRHEQRRRDFPKPTEEVEVKTERQDSTERDTDYSRERPERRRDKHDRHSDRYRFDDRSRERGLDDDLLRSHRSKDEYRKRRHHKDSDKHKERTSGISYDKSSDRRKGYGSDADYENERRSRKSHKHRDFYQIKDELGHEKERNNHHREKERRYDEKRDKTYKQTDRSQTNYADSIDYTDRGRYSEGQDKRYEERYRERVYIKQERDDGTSKDRSSTQSKIESRENRRDKGRYDTSYRDASSDSYSSQRSPKQEKYHRYYDRPSEEFYDPNKKIKTEE